MRKQRHIRAGEAFQTVATENISFQGELDAWFGRFSEIRNRRVYRIQNNCARELVLTLLNSTKTRKVTHREYNQWVGNPVRPATFVKVPQVVCDVIKLVEDVDLSLEELQTLKKKGPKTIVQWLTIRKLLNAPLAVENIKS